MKKIFILILTIICFEAQAQRIKDIIYMNGENPEQIIGYGLVIGLAGTGDSYRSSFTVQSVTSMLQRFGITVPQTDLRTKNAAAVMVTATLNSYMKPGGKFDVTVSSLGDANGLQGGILLMTPLSGMSGTLYGFAQGPVSIGGYDISTSSGGRTAKNHALAGRVPQGGVLKHPLENTGMPGGEISLYLRNPDLTTASNTASAITARFGENTAAAVDPAEIKVRVPADRQNNIVAFLAELENIEVVVDYAAKVVLNEKTGTVVAGSNVIIKPVTISHGSLNLTIHSYQSVSQPGAFSNGTTAIINNLVPYAEEDSISTVALQGASNVQEIANGLNSLKVSPKDIIAIFQALKEAGALVAELIII